jgi:deoxyribonuclease-1-like protein
MKNSPRFYSFVASLLVLSCLGCEPGGDILVEEIPSPNQDRQSLPNSGPPQNSASTGAPRGTFVSQTTQYRGQGLPVRNGQTILVASFNIQVFGTSKMSKQGVPEALAEIIRQFDIVAIQEIRDRSGESLPLLMKYINQNGGRYDYIISQPLGRTNSKEQYAFVFNTDTIITSKEYSYLVEDSADHLHREPFCARFLTRVPQGVEPFRFTLANFHSDPDEAVKEGQVLAAVLKSIRDFEFGTAREDDVLILGDLNLEPKDFGSLARVPGLVWAIQNEPTNTGRTKIWDNILFDQNATSEFTGRCGVLDLERALGLSRDQVAIISDHLPIWMEFVASEQPYGTTSRSARNNASTSFIR